MTRDVVVGLLGCAYLVLILVGYFHLSVVGVIIGLVILLWIDARRERRRHG